MNELKVRTKQNDYDIIAMVEIKPKHGELPDNKLLTVDGYTLHMNDVEAAETRGVCIQVKNKYKSHVVQLDQCKYKDMLCVSVCGSNNKKLLICCVYRSGSPNKAQEHDDDFFLLKLESFQTIRITVLK